MPNTTKYEGPTGNELAVAVRLASLTAPSSLPHIVSTIAHVAPTELGAVGAALRTIAAPTSLSRQTRVRRDGTLTSILTDPVAQAWSKLADVWQTSEERADNRVSDRLMGHVVDTFADMSCVRRGVVCSTLTKDERADRLNRGVGKMAGSIVLDPLCEVPVRTMVQAGRADGSAWNDPEALAVTLASDVTVTTADGVAEVWAWDRRPGVKGRRCVRDAKVIGRREQNAASDRAVRSGRRDESEHVLWSLSLAANGMGLVRSSRLWSEAEEADRWAILATVGVESFVSVADDWSIVRIAMLGESPSAKRTGQVRDSVLAAATEHADRVRHVVGAAAD